MVRLIDVNDQNWLDIARLSVSENQKGFLDRPIGIVARGYAYRSCNAKVIGIADEKQIIGVALVKDMDEAPACYDLQQFMIDKRFQNKGYGTEALRQILSQLRKEGKYSCVEVCVNKDDTAALRVYEKIGFADTGYIDENVPDCLNLMYHFNEESPRHRDILISDFSDPFFQGAFRQYFAELGIKPANWDGLFKEMNDEGGNAAFVRMAENGNVIGFIQFKPITFTSWFFEETYGFIREFWVAEEFRNNGHGTELISLAETYFCENDIDTSILTTDTAEHFYEKHGYVKTPGCKSKNQDNVFIKRLR